MWQLYSPGIKYKGCFEHHRTWKKTLKFCWFWNWCQDRYHYVAGIHCLRLSSITLSHWRTKQSGLFTDPCSKDPPILVIKTIQWIIWWSFGFLCHAVDVCVAMLRRNATFLFRVIESGSSCCWSGWDDTNVSVTWGIWRESGQTEVWEGVKDRANAEAMGMYFKSNPFKDQQWGLWRWPGVSSKFHAPHCWPLKGPFLKCTPIDSILLLFSLSLNS
jgi:hypothetical protein